MPKLKKVKKSDWEIIDTPNGQWEYPGAITRIPSNQITMQGVPYPVLGVSNTGQFQMMYPNQDYQFEGSSVTEYPLPEAGSGYKVIRSNERKGKTHKVIGPDGTVKFFGDSKLGQHPKDPARKKAFYARHKKNLAKNPYFRAFARKTWEEGGELDFAQEGLITLPKDKSKYTSEDSLKHQMAKTFMYENLRGGAQGNHIPNFGYYNSTLPGFTPPTTLQEAVDYGMQEYVPKLTPYQTAMEKGEAFDFMFNTGKDPRAYAIQEYYRQYDPSKLDKDGTWSGRKSANFDEVYKNTIGKLSENERRVLMNKGRDWYYKNINNPSPGEPNPAYGNTWYGRIWNTNDFSPFNPNNPNFTPKKKEGGEQFLTVDGEYHRIYKNADGDIMVNHPKEDKGKWDTINLTDKAGAKTVADGVAATKKWHRENPYAFGGNVILEKYQEGGNIDKHPYNTPKPDKKEEREFLDRYGVINREEFYRKFPTKGHYDYYHGSKLGHGLGIYKYVPKDTQQAEDGGNVWEILPEAQDGLKYGYNWSTQQAPVKLAGNVENPNMQKRTQSSYSMGSPNYVANYKPAITSQTGEQGLGEDIISGTIGAVALPGSLPIKATSRLGRIGLEAANMINPFGGFRNNIKEAPVISNANLTNSLSNAKNKLSNAFEGTSNLLREIVGELKQGKANRQAIQTGNEWLENWIKHPATQQKIENDINNRIDFSEKFLDRSFFSANHTKNIYSDLDVLNMIKDQSKNFKPNSKEYSLIKQLDQNLQQYLGNQNLRPIHEGNLGVSFQHGYHPIVREGISKGLHNAGDRYGSWISRTRKLPQNKRISTTIHEGTHDWVSELGMKESGMRNIALNNMNPKIKKDFLEWEQHRLHRRDPEKEMGKNRAYQAYLADPTEQHARIMELRKHLGLNPSHVTDETYAKKVIEHLESLSKKDQPIDVEGFLKVIDKNPKKLSELFNKFWSVPAVGLAGSAAVNGSQEKKHGGSVWEIIEETPNYQKGGKVVSEIWKDVTGTPWKEAKKLGFTTGEETANLNLRKELLSNPKKFADAINNKKKIETIPAKDINMLSAMTDQPLQLSQDPGVKEYKTYQPVPPNTFFPETVYYQTVLKDTSDKNVPYERFLDISNPEFMLPASQPNMKDEWVKNKLPGVNTKGTVDKLKITSTAGAPNIYRNTGEVCTDTNGNLIPECASGIQLSLDYNSNISGDNRKKLGIKGDAWTMGQNVVNAGGQRIYSLVDENVDRNLFSSSSDVKNYLDSKKKELNIKPSEIENKVQNGDLVEMWYEGSPNQDKALKEGKGTITTHIGIVSEKNGKKYVTHNIHGRWESNPLDQALKTKNVKHGTSIMVSGIVRPDYLDNENSLKTIGVQINPKAKYYSAKSESSYRTPQETEWKTKTPLNRDSQMFTRGLAYYAPKVQEDFNLSDKEMQNLMKLSFGIFGKESGFGESKRYKDKESKRELYELYKNIAPDYLPEGDELSKGKGQIKLDTFFNTPEKRELLSKYGITSKNIWDTENTAAALLLTSAINYKNFSKFSGATFKNMDPLTLQNVLALAHNKGLENVIRNEFTKRDPRKLGEKLNRLFKGEKDWNKKWDIAPTADIDTKSKGFSVYSNLHLNPNSYANLVADYASSLNVDYDKIKKLSENISSFTPRTDIVPPTIDEQFLNSIGEAASNTTGFIEDNVEKYKKAALRKGKKLIRKSARTLKRTPFFENGGSAWEIIDNEWEII